MPLDPQAQAYLASTAGGKPVEQMTVAEMRQATEDRARLTGGQPEPVDRVESRHIPGSGGPIPVRIYSPSAADSQPALVYFHGGGWVRGSLDSSDTLCRALANAGLCTVLAVDYRLAPENVFPAAFDDALGATRWTIEHGPEIGVDPFRVAVGGDSAGGGLAAAVALSLRDAALPPLVCQALIYPVTDSDFDTQSYTDNATGYGLTRNAMRFYWDCYVPDPALAHDPRVSPLRAASLANLPPALVITAEFDPLRDEGRTYAERLRRAGTAVQTRDYAGMIHGFVASAAVIDAGRDAIAVTGAALRSAFTSVASVGH